MRGAQRPRAGGLTARRLRGALLALLCVALQIPDAAALEPTHASSVPLHSGGAFHDGGVENARRAPRVLSMTPSTASTKGGTYIDIELADAPAPALEATTTTTRCRFDDRVVPATRTATGRVRCATPPVGHAGSASLAVSLDGGDTYLLAPASFTFLFPQPQATARQAAAVAAMGAVKPKPGFHRKLLTSDDWWPARFGQFYGFYANPEPPEHTSLCIAASTPVVGPEAGGTVVTLKLAGDLPVNHQVFYCKFDEQVVHGGSFHYTADDGSAAFQCTAPAGSGRVRVTFSLNGVDFSEGGAPFTYHSAVTVDAFTPAITSDTSGDLVRIDFATPYALDAHVDAAAVSASARCKFNDVETAATYYVPDTLRSYPRVVCRALPAALPGIHGVVTVAVALDGQTFTTVSSTAADDAVFRFDQNLELEYFYAAPAPSLSSGFVALGDVDSECVAYEIGRAADASLDSLSLVESANAAYASTGDELGLSSGFPDTLAYTVHVYAATSQVLVTASATQYYSTVQINGGHVQDADVYLRPDGSSVMQWDATAHVNLTVGSNYVNVTVTAPNGVTQKRYVIHVIKYPTLMELQLFSNTAPTTDALGSSFARRTMAYSLSVASTVAAYTAVAVPNDASAVVTMTTSHESHEVASKESSPDLRVDVGVSSVIITVEANGETATYNVTVTRASGTVAALTATALTGLSFWGGFGPLPLHRADGGSGFLDGAFEYSVAVPTQALSLTMARSYNASDVCGAAAAAADAEGVVICAQATAYRFVNLTYDHPLEYGNATVRLYVEAADHLTNATYTLYVFRPDAVLASLEVFDTSMMTAANLTFEANTYNYSAVVPDTIDGLYLRWTGAASSSSQWLLGVKNLTGAHCAGGRLTLVNGQPLYGAVSLAYATCRTVTIRVQAEGAVTGATAVYTVVITRELGGETTLASLALYGQQAAASLTGWTYDVPLALNQTFYSSAVALQLSQPLATETQWITLSANTTVEEGLATVAAAVIPVGVGVTPVPCVTPASLGGVRAAFTGQLACPLSTSPATDTIRINVTSTTSFQSQTYDVYTTMPESQSAVLAAAVLYPTWRYDGASRDTQLVFPAACVACNVTAIVPKEVLAVAVAAQPLNAHASATFRYLSPLDANISAPVPVAATYPTAASGVFDVALDTTYEAMLTVTSQAGGVSVMRYLTIRRALGTNASLASIRLYEAASGVALPVRDFVPWLPARVAAATVYEPTVDVAAAAYDEAASVALMVCNAEVEDVRYAGCRSYDVTNDADALTRLSLTFTYNRLTFTVQSEDNATTIAYSVDVYVVSPQSVLNDLLLSTGVPRVHVGQRANATACAAYLDAAAAAAAQAEGSGDVDAFCTAQRTLAADRCLCADPAALYAARNQTTLAATLHAHQLLYEASCSPQQHPLLQGDGCVQDVSQCGREHCELTAVVPPATSSVHVHVYLTDMQSTLGFTDAAGGAVTAEQCRPRTAGPMVDRVLVEGEAARGVMATCFLVPLGAAGTSASGTLSVTSSDARTTTTFTVTITRDTDDALLPLYGMYFHANGEAGGVFEAGALAVNYTAWTQRYGNDTEYDVTSQAIVKRGNAFGMDTLRPPVFIPQWRLQTHGAADWASNWTAGVRTDLLRYDDTGLSPPLYIKSWRGAVYATIQTAGDYHLNMTLEEAATLDPNGTLPAYATAAFFVQPTAMNFSMSVALVDSSAIRDSRASFQLEARDVYGNPLGSDPHHGPWSLPESYYLPASSVVVDVCDGIDLRDQASLAPTIYGTGSRRRLLQQDATQAECEDLFIQIKGYSVTLEAEPNFCLLFTPFANRGCLCYADLRATMVATYGSSYVDRMASLSWGCGMFGVQCITETNFCPIVDGTNGTVTLDAPTGKYAVSYPATLPGTYSVGVKAAVQVATDEDEAGGSRRRLSAMVTETLSNSPTAHKAQPGEPAAAASVLLPVQSPQQAAELGASLTVSLTDVYGNAAYLGGDAFFLVPQIRSVPLGSQPLTPYTTPAEEEATTYAQALAAGGSDPVAVYLDGFQINDLLTGSYEIRLPATVPGSYSLVVYVADRCDYRTHVARLAAGEQSVCALELLSEAMVQVIPAPISYRSTYAPPCIPASCALDVLTPRSLTVTARDIFRNTITRGSEDAAFSLSVFDEERCWVNAFLADDTVLVADLQCNNALADAMAACDTSGTGSLALCCSLIPSLWSTFADDDNLCLCSSDFRQKDQVEYLLNTIYPAVCTGEPVPSCANLGQVAQRRSRSRSLLQTDQTPALAPACSNSFPIDVADARDGSYVVTFTTPKTAKPFTLQLAVDGLVVAPPLYFEAVQGTVNGSTTTFTVGGPFLPGTGFVNVTARDRFGQPAIGGDTSVVAIVGTTQYPAVETCAVGQSGCGSYSVYFYNQVLAREYLFRVIVRYEELGWNEEIGAGTLVVVPGSATEASTVESLAATYVAGSRGAAFIYARDQYSNRLTRGGNVFALTVLADGGASMPTSVEDVGQGTYLATFDTLATPSIRYELSAALRVGSQRVVYDAGADGNVVERTETVYTYEALVNSPLSFTTIAGTVVAECYAARGLVIDRGWVTAGDPVQTSVFFTPSDVCGDRPLEPPNLRITWGARSSAQEPYQVDCAGGDATAGVLDCALQVIEPVAGEYELRVELDGVLIGCAGEYLDCANPFAVTVAPRPPVAANSRLRAPATHILTAGVNTSTEVTMDVYLADQFGNKLVPDLPGVGGGWTGPSVVFTSPDVAAPVYASVRYSGNPGVWLVHTNQLTVAGAIFTISASFYLVEEAEHVSVPADTGQGAPKISVVPALAEVEYFVFSGSGTAPSLSADTHAAVTIALYDRFRNRVLDPSELHFWSVNSKVAISMFGSVTPEPQYSASPYIVGDRTIRIPFNITTVGTYAVAVSFPDEASRTFYTAAAFRTTVTAGALDARNALAWDLPLARGTLAGRRHQFRIRLRDRHGNVLVAGQPVSFLGSALVGRATGAVVAYDEMEIFNLDNLSLAVRFSTNVADVYDVRMVIDSVAAEQVPPPIITISAAAVDPATSTVAASALAAAVAGAPLRVTVFPRDAYRNVIRAGSAEDDDLGVRLYVRDALELFQSQALVQRTFDEASGGFTYSYTPTLAGAVRLVVAVGEVPVGTSPFPGVVRPAPTSAAHSTLVGPGVAGAVKEIETYITITARDEYGNVNSDGRDLFRVAFVEGDAAGQLALVPQFRPDGLTATGEYLVTYTIPTPQTYTLTVDLPVGGGRYEAVGTATADGASGRSPLLIEVRSANTPFSAIRCVVTGEGLARAVAGRKAMINVTAVDTEGVPMVSGGRTLRFKLDNQLVEDGTVRVTDHQDGRYLVEYVITVAGFYSLLLVDWDGGTERSLGIGRFPATVQVFPAATQPNMSYVDTAGVTGITRVPAVTGVLTATAGRPFTLPIVSQDFFHNPQQYGVAMLSDPFRAIATLGDPAAPESARVLNVRLGASGQYLIEGNVTAAGAYNISLTLGAAPVDTLTLNVAAGAVDLVKTVAYGDGLVVGAVAGTTGQFTVEAKDAFHNTIAATRLNCTVYTRVGPLACTPTAGDDTLTVRYAYTQAGVYWMSVELGVLGGAAPRRLASPAYQSLRVLPEHNASAVTSSANNVGLALRTDVGDAASLQLVSRDRFANPLTAGGMQFAALITGPKGTARSLPVVDGGDGVYYSAFLPIYRGVYAIEVTLGGVEVKDSPFPLVVSAAATHAPSTYVTYATGAKAALDGAMEVTAGEAGRELRVWTYDEYGNSQINAAGDALIVQDTVTALVSHGADATLLLPAVSAVEATATHYAFTVAGTMAGNSVLDVRVGGARVFGAPFALAVRAAAVDPAACIAVDVPQVERPTEATASQLYAYFRVHALDRFNNSAVFRPETYTSVECIASPMRLPDRADVTPAVVTVTQETDERTAQFVMSWLVRIATTWADEYDLTFRVDGQPLTNLVTLPAVLPGPLDLPKSTLEGAGVDDAGAVVGRVAVQRVVGRDRFGNRQTMTSTAIAGYTFVASYALRKPTPAGFVEITTQSDFVSSATTVGLIDGHIRLEMVAQVSGVLVTSVVAAGDSTTDGTVAILASPFTGEMSALPPTLEKTSVEGLGLAGSRTGVTAELEVRLRDVYGNPSPEYCSGLNLTLAPAEYANVTVAIGNATAAFNDRCVLAYTVTLPEFDENHTQYSQAAFNLTVHYDGQRVGEPHYPVVVRRQIGEWAPAQTLIRGAPGPDLAVRPAEVGQLTAGQTATVSVQLVSSDRIRFPYLTQAEALAAVSLVVSDSTSGVAVELGEGYAAQMRFMGDGLVEVEYELFHTGSYQLQLSADGVLRKTYTNVVVPDVTDATASEFTLLTPEAADSNFTSYPTFAAAAPVSVQVIPRDALGNLQAMEGRGTRFVVRVEKMTPAVEDTPHDQLLIQDLILDATTGYYLTMFRRNALGSYRATVTLGDRTVGTAAFDVTLGQVDPLRTHSYGEGARIATAGVQATVFYSLRDYGNNVLTDPGLYAALLPSLTGRAVLQSFDLNDEQMTLSVEMHEATPVVMGQYTATRGGFYNLELHWTSTLETHKTFGVQLVPAPMSVHDSDLEAPRDPQAGRLRLNVYPNDQWGNAVTSGGAVVMVEVDGPARFVSEVAVWNSSFYSVDLDVPLAGNYSLSLRAPGDAASTADGPPPVTHMLVKPSATVPAMSTVEGIEGDGAFFQVGVTTTVRVTARDRFGNQKHDSSDHVEVEYFIREGEVGPSEDAGGFPATPSTSEPGVYIKPLNPLTSSPSGLSIRVRVNAVQVLEVDGLAVLPGGVYALACSATPVPTTGTSLSTALVAGAGANGTSARLSVAHGTAGYPFHLSMRPADFYGNAANGSTVDLMAVVRLGDATPVEYRAVRKKGDVDHTDMVAVFTLTVAGSYQLRATSNGIAFYGAGRTDNLIIAPGDVHLPSSQVTMAATYTVLAQSSLSMVLRDRYGNAVTAAATFSDPVTITSVSADGDDVTVTPVHPADVSLRVSDGTYTVHFTPFTTGSVVLSLSVADEPLLDPLTALPYRTSVLSGPARASQCIAVGSGVAVGAAQAANGTFFIKARDQYGFELTQPATGTFRIAFYQSVPLFGFVEHVEKGLYMAKYYASTTGQVDMFVTYDNLPIKGSAFRISLAGTVGYATAARSRLLGPDRTPLGRRLAGRAAGEETTLFVELADDQGVALPQTGDDLSSVIRLRVSPPPLYEPAVSRTADGLYRFTLAARVAGEYAIDAYVGGLPVGNSGVLLKVSPAPTDPARTALSAALGNGTLPSPLPVTAGTQAYVFLRSVDQWGNPQAYASMADLDPYVATVAEPGSPASSPALPASVRNLGTGVYEVVFTLTSVGATSLSISMGGVPTASLPIVVSHGPFSPLLSTAVAVHGGEAAADDEAVPAVEAGTALEVAIHALDVFGNAYTARGLLFQLNATGASYTETRAAATDATDVYVAYLPMVTAGEYTVIVAAMGELVGTLSARAYAAAPSASASRATGAGVQGVTAGSVASFTVAAMDAFGNAANASHALSVTSTPPLAFTVEPLSQSDASRNPGAALVSYTPTELPPSGSLSVTVAYGNDTVGTWSVPVGRAASPVLVSAVLGESLSRIQLHFDVPTDRGNLGSSTDCSRVLADDTLAQLGVSPSCRFVGGTGGSTASTVLEVELGAGATMLPEGTAEPGFVTLKPGRIGRYEGASLFASGSVPLQLPASFDEHPHAFDPVVVVSAPTQVGRCDDVVLDATASTNSGGRPMTFAYQLVSVQPDFDAAPLTSTAALVASLPANTTAAVHTVAAALLQPGAVYTIAVTAANFLGRTSTPVRLTVRKFADSLPRVTVLGARQRSVTAAHDTVLQGVVSLQAPTVWHAASGRCVPNDGSVAPTAFDYRWSTMLSGSPASLSALPELHWDDESTALYRPSAASPTLRLPSHSLLPGATYTFVLTATTAAPEDPTQPAPQHPVRVSTAVTLHVALAPLAVTVRGGQSRTVPSATLLTLVADASDPSASAAPSGQPYPFTYRWAVHPHNTSVPLSAAVFAALTTPPTNLTDFGRELSLPAGALPPGDYTVSVAVSRAPLAAGRVEVAASTVITVAAASTVPTLEVVAGNAAAVVGLSASGLGLDSAKQLELRCVDETVNKTLQPLVGPLVWTVHTSVPGATADSLLVQSEDRTSVTVAAGLLLPGNTYRFECADAATGARATATVPVAAQPAVGRATVTASPTRSDTFTVAAEGFVSAVPGGGLLYEYRYVLNAERVERPLKEPTLASSATFTLPSGNITLVLYVRHASDAPGGPLDLPSGVRIQLPSVQSSPPGAASSPAALARDRRRQLLQAASSESSSAVEAAAAFKREVLDVRVLEGDASAAAVATQIFGEDYGALPEGADGLTCITARPQMVALKEQVLAQLQRVDAAAVATGVYMLQAACAVAAVASAPGELSAAAAAAAVSIAHRSLRSLTETGATVAPLPGGDPFECAVATLDLTLTASSLNCGGLDEDSRYAAVLNVVDSLRTLGAAMGLSLTDAEPDPLAYSMSSFTLQVIRSRGAVTADAGAVRAFVSAPQPSQPLVVTAVHFRVPVLSHPYLIGTAAVVFVQGEAAAGMLSFGDVPTPGSLPQGRILGMRFLGPDGELESIPGVTYEESDGVGRVVGSTLRFDGFFAVFSEQAPSPPPPPSPPPSPPPPPPPMPPPSPPPGGAASDDAGMSLSLVLGASGGGVALLLLVTCVYLRRRRGQRVNEIVPRIS